MLVSRPQAEIVNVVRLELDGLLVILDRLVEIARVAIADSQTVVVGEVLRLQLNGL